MKNIARALLAAPPAERVHFALSANVMFENRGALLGSPELLLFPIPFDAPHRRGG